MNNNIIIPFSANNNNIIPRRYNAPRLPFVPPIQITRPNEPTLSASSLGYALPAQNRSYLSVPSLSVPSLSAAASLSAANVNNPIIESMPMRTSSKKKVRTPEINGGYKKSKKSKRRTSKKTRTSRKY